MEFIALLLPWLVGIVWIRLLFCQTPNRHWAMEWGYAYLLGIFTTTLLMRAVHLLGFEQNFLVLLAILTFLALLGVALLLKIPDHSPRYKITPAPKQWQNIVISMLLGLLLLRLLGIGFEMIWRPLTPWDAWASWSQKAKVWYELRSLVPFVDTQQWLRTGGGEIYTSAGYAYPVTIPLIQVWTALGIGHWDDALISLPWLLCAVALGLGFYGQLRQSGCSAWLALLFTYLLLSQPLLNAHIALGGYADLWMACGLGMTVMSFFQWQYRKDRRQGVLALLMALFCLFTKEEGVIWILCLAPALLFALFGFRVLVSLLGALLGGVLLILWSGGLQLDFGSVGKVIIAADYVQFFSLEFHPAFHPIGKSLIKNLWVRQNWHLFWYIWPFLFIFVCLRSRAQRAQAMLSLVVITGIAALAFIFYCTENYQWAVSSTAINRLILHWMPVFMFHLALGLAAYSDRPDEEMPTEGHFRSSTNYPK